MAQTTRIELTDDLDGTPATETITFGLDGATYEIDLNNKNAKALRRDLEKYTKKARKASSSKSQKRSGGNVTLFSQLSSEEKEDFRVWANLPDARRIADARVLEWKAAKK